MERVIVLLVVAVVGISAAALMEVSAAYASHQDQ